MLIVFNNNIVNKVLKYMFRFIKLNKYISIYISFNISSF